MQVISREKQDIVNNFGKLLITLVDFFENTLVSVLTRVYRTFAFG